MNRSNGDTATQMYMINHYLDKSLGNLGVMPDKASLGTTNSKASLDKHLANCNMLYGRAPTFVLLDFYSSNGNEPFEWAANLNGVPAPTNKVETGNIDGKNASPEDVAGAKTGTAAAGSKTGVIETQDANGVNSAASALTAGAASAAAAALGAAAVFLF